MNEHRPRSLRSGVAGPAGNLEVAFDLPASPALGLALVGHPHPLYGGTLDNKVAATLARSFVSLGWIAARPNFRGVGASEGRHDGGIGETEDFLFLAQTLPQLAPCAGALLAQAPLALAGFSFGSFVAARAAAALAAQSRPARTLVLVGAAAGKWPMPPVPADTLVVHGEWDETIPLAQVLDWARACDVPVVVVPGADHFFHRRLLHIKRLVRHHCRGVGLPVAMSPEGDADE